MDKFNKNINILHILPSGYKGGSELCALETIKSLETNNNFVILPEEQEFLPELEKHTKQTKIIPFDWWVTQKRWPLLLKIKMLKGYYNSAKQIASFAKENNIDLIITHSIVYPVGALGAKFAKIPHIWYIHEYGDIDHGFIFVYTKRLSLLFINKFSKQIIVNSKALFNHFSNYLPTKKLNIIYYVVEYPLTKPNNNGTLNEICMVGRIAPGKNQLVALRAIQILKQQGISLNIKFLGGKDDVYLEQLVDFINKNDLLKNVKFVGFTDQPYLEVLKSEIILVCSKNEAFGRVTIEGMKSGKVVIASNTGAGKELINNKVNGYLFSPDNENELASILKDVIKNSPQDKIKQNAFSFASENFTYQKHRETIVSIIEKTL